MVAHDLGEKTTPALDKLRKATVHWAMDLLGTSENKYLNKDFWLKASDNLYHQGKATEACRHTACSDAGLFRGFKRKPAAIWLN